MFDPLDLWYDDSDRPDCAEWFTAHGWTTRSVDSRDEFERVGRPPSASADEPAALPQLSRHRRTAAPTGWLGSRVARLTVKEDRTMTTESVTRKESEPPPPPGGIPETVARLRKTFAAGRTRSVDWRKDQLLKLEKMMAEKESAIADALAEDLDRSPFEAWLGDSARHRRGSQVRGKTRQTLGPPETPPARACAVAGPGLDRVRAVRHRPDHRRVELPDLPDARPPRRRDCGGKHRGAQAIRDHACVIPTDGRAGAEVSGLRCDRGRGGRWSGQPGADRTGFRPGHVHRRHRDRPQGLRRRRPAPDAGHAGAGR